MSYIYITSGRKSQKRTGAIVVVIVW